MQNYYKGLEKEEIIEFVRDGRKISLIKEFRAKFNSGLKDAKGAIESCQLATKDPITQRFRFDEEKILRLFFNDSYSMLVGIECAINNYEKLGFTNIYDAVRSIVSNYELAHNQTDGKRMDP